MIYDRASIIIPSLNERNNLIRLIKKLNHESFKSIYVIDDGSTDGTASLKEQFPNVHFLFRQNKMGLISAEIDGMRLSNSDYVVIMDADLSHKPEDIKGMIELAVNTSSDLVIGSRYTENGISNDEFIRKGISRVANLLFHFSFDVNISDCTSGFRIYSRKACDFLSTQVDLENSYVGQVDILNRLNRNGFKISEYPVEFVKRTEGKSKLKMKEIVNFFLFVIYNKKLLNYITGSISLIISLIFILYIFIILYPY